MRWLVGASVVAATLALIHYPSGSVPSTRANAGLLVPVNLLKRHRISWPRVEHADTIETLGATPGALERGFREAISEMLRWLMQDYGLSQQEAHTLVAMTTELKVASWFGTTLCVIPKDKLPPR